MTWKDETAYCKVCGKRFEVESTSPSRVERAVLDAFFNGGWRFIGGDGSLICKDCIEIIKSKREEDEE